MKAKSIFLFLLMVGLFAGNISAKRIAKHVVLIGYDGWASAGYEQSDMPTVKKLASMGSYTLKKRSVLPSSSAINWATMFMGAGPELHGYTQWNTKTPDLPSRVILKNNIFPTIFQLLREADAKAEIGVVYEWDGIKHVVDTLSLNYYDLASDYEKNPDHLCVMAEKYIKEKRPTLFAICFDSPDHPGHAIGWSTPEYFKNVNTLDGYAARIIAAIKEAGIYDDTIIIVTADHGGIERGHGGKTMNEMETPFIIAGKGVRQGGEFKESMMQYDVASTIAYIFGLKQPQVWVGRPMKQVFK